MAPPSKRFVYILFNEENAQFRFRATKFVMEKGFIPLYSTMVKDFYTARSVTTRDTRESMIKKADEVWVFGDINASMQDQIMTGKHNKKPVRHFYVISGQFWEKELDEPVRTYK